MPHSEPQCLPPQSMAVIQMTVTRRHVRTRGYMGHLLTPGLLRETLPVLSTKALLFLIKGALGDGLVARLYPAHLGVQIPMTTYHTRPPAMSLCRL